MEFLGLCGKALSAADAANIAASLLVLSKEKKINAVFWGRISGCLGEYYVAAAENATDPLDQFRPCFFSVDGGVNWQPLLEPNAEQSDFCDQIRGPFMGQPKFEYKIQKELPIEAPVAVEIAPIDELQEPTEEEQPDEPSPEEEGEKAEGDAPTDGEATQEVKKPKRPKFRILAMFETTRLAHFVRQHDAYCRVVPRGSLQRKDDGAVIRNRWFSGLDAGDASIAANFSKLSLPHASQVSLNEVVFGPKYHPAWDFLVPITSDMPKGTWSLKLDSTVGVVTVENLLFPGSFFFHKLQSSLFGQFYIGDGRRNVDLCFMLP